MHVSASSSATRDARPLSMSGIGPRRSTDPHNLIATQRRVRQRQVQVLPCLLANPHDLLAGSKNCDMEASLV